MNKRELKTHLHKITRDCIVITEHCKIRMRERDIVVDDILFAIMWGNITEIEEDPIHNNWKCSIIGKDIEGEELTVVVAIDIALRSIICVTVC